MWKTFVSNLTDEPQFASPISIDQRLSAESALGAKLPDDLDNLLHESNGIIGEHDLGLIWEIERIQSDNLAFRNNNEFRDLYMPFDHLLFFADAGNGDQFAYTIQNGTI